MNQRTQHLRNLLISVFEESPWYGDAVMKKLKQIPHHIVNISPVPGTNSVAKLVKHMVNWRALVIEVLRGNAAYNIEINSQEDWPDIHIDSAAQWEELIEELKYTQKHLCDLLDGLSDERLDQKASGREYTNLYMIEGIIHHDIYHLAQIAVVAKQAKSITD